MKPVAKYILLNHIEEELKTDSGILLSGDEANKRRYHKGTIVSVGEEVKAIKKNDVIYYDHRGSHTLLIEGVKITVIQERDVVVVL